MEIPTWQPLYEGDPVIGGDGVGGAVDRGLAVPENAFPLCTAGCEDLQEVASAGGLSARS